jgi:hypothetical protein
MAPITTPLTDIAREEATFSICSHCGDGPDLLSSLLVAIILLPLLFGFKRLLLGSDDLIELRLNDDPPASPPR